MNREIAIRADVSAKIGFGHLKRCLSLAKALKANGHRVRFVCRELGVDAQAQVARDGFDVMRLPEPGKFTPPPGSYPHAEWAGISEQDDAVQTCAVLAGSATDLVIVDHYAFGSDWHRAVAAGTGAQLMVIDDLADRPIAADWLVDHNYHPDHRAKYAGRLNPDARMMTGPLYAMLDPSYADAPRYGFRQAVKSIGIFLGGIDAKGDSVRVLQAIRETGWDGAVEIVTTSANPTLGILQDEAKKAGATMSIDLEGLAPFFARHDLQIGAGGGAIWERCCIGAPTVCLIIAENQRASVPLLDGIGALLQYDLTAKASSQRQTLGETIERAVRDNELRNTMRTTAMDLVDGRGAHRIADAVSSARRGL